MASGMINSPDLLFYKDYTAEVSFSVGVNNVVDVTVTISDYTPIAWVIQSGSTVALRNSCTLLGINRSMHPQVYVTETAAGSMTFRIYYLPTSKVVAL